MVVDYDTYNIDFRQQEKGKREMKKDEKGLRIKLKKSNKMAKRLPIGILILVIPSAFMKNVLS